MIRFKIDLQSTEILDRLTSLYSFKRDTVTARIAFSISIFKGMLFNEEDNLGQSGREYSPTSNVFGNYVNNTDNVALFRVVLEQHYSRSLTDSEFIRLYKLHLKHGLVYWTEELLKHDITRGGHISYLVELINSGLALRSRVVNVSSTNENRVHSDQYGDLLLLTLGKREDGEDFIVRLNDLRDFDNRNMAIAGMAGSGKTQFVKDLLYQMAVKTNNKLKFIFFDYKGEGNQSQLAPFLKATNCQFVDIVKDGGVKFNPFLSISSDHRQRPFSIRAFVDTISAIATSIGSAQRSILISIVEQIFKNAKDSSVPSIQDFFDATDNYYAENNRTQDSLYAVIRDISTNIFNCSKDNPSLFEHSMYLNLPPDLSDTLRQLVVFLLLRYFNTYFSSTNDCEPNEHIFPLRYVIVIDEAHIYLKNKNARKALEELLRLLRSKGVVIIMLTQGVDDFKTKDFDFASQVQLPICLNVQNKDYKLITNFIGTPLSKHKLQLELAKLESGKGLVNIGEPRIIQLNQWWRTLQNLKLDI
jgi:DNA sulfur modification protein DndE